MCFTKRNWEPHRFLSLSDKEQLIVLAFLEIETELEKEQTSRIKK